ncbi:hypothetical protein WA026_005614 [Henosepilachna vigintioctopunctata]|uniref:Major facilitator superfamily (MFS) profile domain-containing protein n=1 Tax=Henosepilachna vigintioctopunctata TaxID=420089 RepID=A0AAW1U2N4_9CUCU
MWIFERNLYIQYLAVGFVSINVINGGMVYGWPSAFLPQLQDTRNTHVKFHITPYEGSWVAIASLLGVLIGAPFAALNVDHIGRRKMILFSVLPYFINWILTAIADCFGVLFIGRLIAGISDGIMYTSVPMYIGEISSPEIRGRLGSTLEISILIGVILINILEMIFTLSTTALLSALVPVISFSCMLSMPESPYFLLMKNHFEEAETALQFLRGSEDIEQELNDINAEVKLEMEQSKGSFKDLFTIQSNRKSLLLILLLRGCQQLTGIKAFVFYFPLILSVGGSESSWPTIFGFAILLASAIAGANLVDYIGRRKLILVSLIGVTTALILEGIYFQIQQSTTEDSTSIPVVLLIAMFIFVIFYGFGLDIVPIVMITELFSTNIKSMSNCIEEVYTVILGALVTKFFQAMDTAETAYIAFYFFASCSITSLILIYFYVPETKGITLEEIQILLKIERNQKIENND